LVVANRIYQLVFNPNWVQKKLTDLSRQNTTAITLVPEKSTAVVLSPRRKKSFLVRNLLLLLALFSLLSVFIYNMTKRIEVRKTFDQGNELLKQKSYDKAVAKYNRLLNIDSNYFQAWTNRGYALAGLQKYAEMRQSCSTATIIEPTAVFAWNCQGEALHNLKQDKKALKAFNQAIALNKDDPIFLINKSESLVALGRTEDALVTIKSAIQVLEQLEKIKGKAQVSGEFAVALTFLANNYRKQGQYTAAEVNYNRALEYSANYFPAQIGKGIVLNQLQRYSEAEQEFGRVLNDPHLTKARQAQAWFYLGKTLCDSQHKQAGISAFNQAIQQQPNYQAAQQAKQECQ
jgi:tetratricopeptide (TPR) repeat protein